MMFEFVWGYTGTDGYAESSTTIKEEKWRREENGEETREEGGRAKYRRRVSEGENGSGAG